ncbi:hypothetical protein Ddye_014844 [Dipteronia dyeriana]|uniref:HAT C-terminal dimerisation domain-containing protein n=1 Tax=Dipteronia dyeriana TaxID=168575 RepID=A0AAD9WZ12_9ROSI|nr:hypothetical protein Ddye_014844 [Dipteronia dyeriana]
MFRGDEEFELYKSQTVSNINKTELKMYFDEQVENNSPDFDILSWWKGNKGKYLILAKIVRDILAIPISMVASESAFSVRGRFLSPRRRILHLDTLDALMCIQNWTWDLIRDGIPGRNICYNKQCPPLLTVGATTDDGSRGELTSTGDAEVSGGGWFIIRQCRGTMIYNPISNLPLFRESDHKMEEASSSFIAGRTTMTIGDADDGVLDAKVDCVDGEED